jgi:hypothetical protein
MIQRKQTLFLFQLVFLGIALLFIPAQTVVTTHTPLDIYLVPIAAVQFSSSTWHLVAISLNFLGLVMAFVTIFLYRRRELQIKLCYLQMIIWAVLTLMILYCSFITWTDGVVKVEKNYLACIIGVLAIVAAFLAARFIKKDIELLKSADRIR